MRGVPGGGRPPDHCGDDVPGPHRLSYQPRCDRHADRDFGDGPRFLGPRTLPQTGHVDRAPRLAPEHDRCHSCGYQSGWSTSAHAYGDRRARAPHSTNLGGSARLHEEEARRDQDTISGLKPPESRRDFRLISFIMASWGSRSVMSTPTALNTARARRAQAGRLAQRQHRLEAGEQAANSGPLVVVRDRARGAAGCLARQN